jgi:hypothetical protein
MALTKFSQQDPRWASTKYQDGFTIGRYGCEITNLAMIYDWFFLSNKTPLYVAQNLKFNNGDILWSSLPKINLKLEKRYYSRDDNRITQALNNPNECCTVQVNNNHWLFIIGRKLPVLGYKVTDPWLGDTCYTNRYKNNITGFAVITK